MPTSLVIGASRGLGLELAKALHAKGNTVFATVRSPPPPQTFPDGVNVIPSVDVGTEDAGKAVVEGLKGSKIDLVVINAGYFKTEVRIQVAAQQSPPQVPRCAEILSRQSINRAIQRSWRCTRLSPSAPSSSCTTCKFYCRVALVTVRRISKRYLCPCSVASNSFAPDAKLILITTEGGSITLRTKEEGGGNYGHHGSKAAANMVGKLIAHDLLEKGITVVMIHVRSSRYFLSICVEL